MIVQGVLVPASAAAWLAKAGELLAFECRRDGSRLPVEVATVFDECARVARVRRVQATAALSVPVGTPERSAEACSGTLSAMEVAVVLGCSSRNVRALAARGSLPGERLRGRWSFDPADIADYRRSMA